MMSKYTDIFFDLDRTIWDFETNAEETFRELYSKYELEEKGITDFDAFYGKYQEINTHLWDLYRDGHISKEELRDRRFNEVLQFFGVKDEDLANKIADYYITQSPLKQQLFPNAIETLENLSKNFRLHIITNGFEEVQTVKMKASGLEKYFDCIITSEMAGFKKPKAEIFDYAMKCSGTTADKAIMIGDDYEVDIIGAKGVGMDQIWFNVHPEQNGETATYIINDLAEINEII